MIKKIHVNPYNIRMNLKDGQDRPVCMVKLEDRVIMCHEVNICGSSKLVYPEKLLEDGTAVWIQTKDKIELLDREGNVVEIID